MRPTASAASGSRARRLLWFVALWAMSVLSVFVVAELLRGLFTHLLGAHAEP